MTKEQKKRALKNPSYWQSFLFQRTHATGDNTTPKYLHHSELDNETDFGFTWILISFTHLFI